MPQMIYGPWLTDALSQWFSGKTVKALATTSAITQNTGATYRSEITGELTGGGYTPGGVVASNVTVSWNATSERVIVTSDVIDFGAVTAADVAGIVYYVDTGNPAADRVLWSDVFTPVAAEGALSYTPSGDGLMFITV